METKTVNSFDDISHSPYTTYIVGQGNDYILNAPPPTVKERPLRGRDFAIYLMEYNAEEKDGVYQITSTTYIPITVFQDNSSTAYATYGEKLSMAENEQYTLTFSISLYVNGEENVFAKRLHNNTRLRFVDAYRKVDFIVTSINPTITDKNVIFTVEAESAFSYIMSKTGVGYETYIPENDPLAWWAMPHTITEIVERILRENKVFAPGFDERGDNNLEWTLAPRLYNNLLSVFPNDLEKFTTRERLSHARMCLNVSDSNVYNAIIETMLLFGGILSIKYNDDRPGGVLDFINKQAVEFKGYRLRPDINLTALSLAERNHEYCTLMRVFGSEAADGTYINMIPTMPTVVTTEVLERLQENPAYYFDKDDTMMTLFGGLPTNTPEEHRELINYCNFIDTYIQSLDSYLYNFDDLVESGVITPTTRDRLIATYRKLRNCNITTQALSSAQLALSFMFQENYTDEQERISNMAALNRSYLFGNLTNIEYQNQLSTLFNNLNTQVYKSSMAVLAIQLHGNSYPATDWNEINAPDGVKVRRERAYNDYLEEAADAYKRSGATTIADFINNTIDYNLLGKYSAAIEQAKLLEAFVPVPKKVGDDGNIVLQDDVVSGRELEGMSFYDMYKYVRIGTPGLTLEAEIAALGKEDQKGIGDLLEAADTQREQVNQSLYALSTFILERNYIDETQLAYDGLYMSASREFATYNRPTEEYAASMINYNALVDNFRQDIAVGDLIHVYSPLLWDKEGEELCVYTTDPWKTKRAWNSWDMTSINLTNSTNNQTHYTLTPNAGAYDHLAAIGSVELEPGTLYTITFKVTRNTLNNSLSLTTSPASAWTSIDETGASVSNLIVSAGETGTVTMKRRTKDSFTGVNYGAWLFHLPQGVEGNECDIEIYLAKGDVDGYQTRVAWKKPGYPDSIEGVFEAMPVHCKPTTIKTIYGTEPVFKTTLHHINDPQQGWELGDLYGISELWETEGEHIHYTSRPKLASERELQITGIERDLRSLATNLSVENNRTINGIVDKLLMSIRRK